MQDPNQLAEYLFVLGGDAGDIPPGPARLMTNPLPTAFDTVAITIGIVLSYAYGGN